MKDPQVGKTLLTKSDNVRLRSKTFKMKGRIGSLWLPFDLYMCDGIRICTNMCTQIIKWLIKNNWVKAKQ